MKIIIVVPAYNEAERIDKVLSQALKKTRYNIIVIDDGSDDST